ncbi:hypothetical protein B0H17DRAFT_1146971 [Mycena rosella]|uniref:Uncharacterized protein n=1 Tax=Mycena rosella TaxID=1033263 RepID=A0AAD7G4B0_MYCRO|nr:hypothetical protein B0H17DRAFT_1146971 [Mycena rosella]
MLAVEHSGHWARPMSNVPKPRQAATYGGNVCERAIPPFHSATLDHPWRVRRQGWMYRSNNERTGRSKVAHVGTFGNFLSSVIPAAARHRHITSTQDGTHHRTVTSTVQCRDRIFVLPSPPNNQFLSMPVVAGQDSEQDGRMACHGGPVGWVWGSSCMTLAVGRTNESMAPSVIVARHEGAQRPRLVYGPVMPSLGTGIMAYAAGLQLTAIACQKVFV